MSRASSPPLGRPFAVVSESGAQASSFARRGYAHDAAALSWAAPPPTAPRVTGSLRCASGCVALVCTLSLTPPRMTAASHLRCFCWSPRCLPFWFVTASVYDVSGPPRRRRKPYPLPKPRHAVSMCRHAGRATLAELRAPSQQTELSASLQRTASWPRWACRSATRLAAPSCPRWLAWRSRKLRCRTAAWTTLLRTVVRSSPACRCGGVSEPPPRC